MKILAVVVYLLNNIRLFCNPKDWSLPGTSVQDVSQARTVEWIVISFSRGSSWFRDQTYVSCISCIGRWILLPLNHLGSPKDTGVGSHSLLQQIFPTQGSNLDLSHCRQILYHLSWPEDLSNDGYRYSLLWEMESLSLENMLRRNPWWLVVTWLCKRKGSVLSTCFKDQEKAV